MALGNASFAQGDPARGEDLYNQCSSCHEVGAGAEDGIGPHLNQILDRPAGLAEGYRYSNGMKRVAADGLVWDADTLDAFLANPRGLVPGTRMSFRGVPEAQDRADLLAYLGQFSASESAEAGSTAPSETASFQVAPEVLAIVGDPAYGEYLSGDCTSCHQLAGATDGIPSIVNWPTDNFVTKMHAYKDGHREHEVMQMMAGRLSNEEIAALAAYFANVE